MAEVVAVDAPVGGEGVDDAEAVAAAVGVGGGGGLGPAVVLDLEPQVVVVVDLGADGEVPAWFGGAAVQCGVGSRLGGGQDGIVGDRAAV